MHKSTIFTRGPHLHMYPCPIKHLYGPVQPPCTSHIRVHPLFQSALLPFSTSLLVAVVYFVPRAHGSYRGWKVGVLPEYRVFTRRYPGVGTKASPHYQLWKNTFVLPFASCTARQKEGDPLKLLFFRVLKLLFDFPLYFSNRSPLSCGSITAGIVKDILSRLRYLEKSGVTAASECPRRAETPAFYSYLAPFRYWYSHKKCFVTLVSRKLRSGIRAFSYMPCPGCFFGTSYLPHYVLLMDNMLHDPYYPSVAPSTANSSEDIIMYSLEGHKHRPKAGRTRRNRLKRSLNLQKQSFTYLLPRDSSRSQSHSPSRMACRLLKNSLKAETLLRRGLAETPIAVGHLRNTLSLIITYPKI